MTGLADAALEDLNITVDVEGPDAPKVHDDDTIETPTEEGGVVVSFNPLGEDNDGPGEGFDANLALSNRLSDTRQTQIVETLLEQIEADIKSRSEWMETRANAIRLLGFKIEDPKSDVGSSSSPMDGMSTHYDTLLAEAVLRAHATACGELLPAEGPVKVTNSGRGTEQTEGMAEALQKDLNYWFTSVAKEYYPDTKRMLFLTVFGGSGFKKGYHCPIKRRPTIESVDAKDVIVSAGATDVMTAARVTHRLEMRQSIMRRMQVLGVYRDVDLVPPSPAPKDAATTATEEVSGQRTGQERPEDAPYELYESYCEVDINEFAPPQFKGKKVPLPYRVTIEKESRTILDIRRDWKEEDKTCLRKRSWVKYPYIEAMSFYCLGLMHVVGNLTLALTAGGREALDAGMMANFPGLLIAKWAARNMQEKTNMRVYAGEAQTVDTGEKPIGDAVMGMPYHDVTAGLLGILQQLTEKGQRLAGSGDLPVGEGRQDAPVGTTIALIEQATKVESNVHKGMHTAQTEEFEIVERLLREDPESFWRHNPECSMDWDEATFISALDSCMIVPRADPNTPSHIHRLLKAMGLKQLQAQSPGLYDPKSVDRRILAGMGWDDVEDLFAKQDPNAPPPQPDPQQIMAQAKILAAQVAGQKVQVQAAELQQQGMTKKYEMEMEQQIEQLRLQREQVIHQDQHLLDTAGHHLDAQQQAHEQNMDRQNAGIEAMKAGHAAAMDRHNATMDAMKQAHEAHADQAKHGLDALTAAHDAALGVAGHRLDVAGHNLAVHEANKPPEPKTP
jgi:hypothetical protein